MIADDDDDTHFCLKCHSTIIGLDNYVNHRKTTCAKIVQSTKSTIPISQLLPSDESFGLKADDFFSSLELQSSSKKAQSTSGKNFSGILTRSKTTAAIQALAVKDDITQSKSGKNVWIGGHQLKLGYGDNQSKLIKAVDNLERRKDPLKVEDVSEASDDESFDYVSEDDDSCSDDDDAPPRNHTGGKWKPSSPIHWEAPPPTHTGGKWKPVLKRNVSPPPSHTKGKWKPSFSYDYPPATFTGSKWSQSKAKECHTPPTTYTKGKWKPSETETSETSKVKVKHLEDDLVPSPSYTKGKWFPSQDVKKNIIKITDDSPLRKSSGTVQYWCRPCNRRLSSKIVYERHLKSELHYKRTLDDREFEDNFGVNPEKRTKIDESTKTEPIKKRKRKPIFTKCEVCKSKVNCNLIGKHLISHYHCRRGDITSTVAQKMVLDYINEIIQQSPFQCGICKFYFNNEQDFLQHWLTESHILEQARKNGYFWCALCKFRNNDTFEMYNHLTSREHSEVVAVINRSVPIIIKKLNPVKCGVCQKEFLLNIQLKQHCQRTNHILTNLEENYICSQCNQICKSNLSLKFHKQSVHQERSYICTPCKKTFKTAEETKIHRSTAAHKFVINRKTKEKKCEFCDKIFPDFPKFKQHMKKTHPLFCPRCPHCGMTFVVSQEISVHLRTKSCKVQKTSELSQSCDLCSFTTDSPSELLFHKLLHGDPLKIFPISEKMNQKPKLIYPCPLCEKYFPKSSLQAHLRIHTQERLFGCGICNKSFVRKNNWLFHLKNHEKRMDEKKEERKIGRPFLCSTCGASFKRRSILQQHMTIHSGKMYKCPKLGCVFSARSMSELKAHFRTHSDIKNFACSLCDYRGKTKQQLSRHSTIHDDVKKHQCSKCQFSARTISHLKRHYRLHTGAKPFFCPHCDYKCNNLENLRKHVLSSKKHPEKCLYECHFCEDDQFQCNFAKEFKAHLIMQHQKMFSNKSDIATYIAGIYDAKEDNSEVTSTETDSAKSKTITSTISSQIIEDSVVAGCSKEETGTDEIFPMYIVSKDDGTSDNLPETWNLIGSYDVGESGALVSSFANDTEVLFEEHF